MQRSKSADELPLVSPDRVRNEICVIIAQARAQGWTLDKIARDSGVKVVTIKGWLHDEKEPSLSRALSVSAILGQRAVNSILSIIGYGGASPLDEPDGVDLARVVSDGLADLSVIASAAADGRIDHTEEPAVTAAADHLIATYLPLSSARRAE